jgi:dTDP-L-rhamnose 4-epimerase
MNGVSRVLITGGAGFIGSRLALALVQRNPLLRVSVFDSLHPQVHGERPSVPRFPSQVTFIRGDMRKASEVLDAVRSAQAEVVFHLAAETGTGQSYDEPARYCDANIIGTCHLIEAMRSERSAQRVVLAGSRAVYGEGAYVDATGREYVGLPRDPAHMARGEYEVRLPSDARGPARPSASHAGLAAAPASIYASTKLMQEYLLCQAGQDAAWKATILRFQNVFGPGQSLRNPYTGVLSVFARQILEGRKIAIYEDGAIARDFVFVDDVVDALMRAGERPLPHATILDIGSGSGVTILQIARMLMGALARHEDAYSITGEFRVGDVRHACADIRRAGELLEWKPATSLDRGIALLAAWARTQFENKMAG